MKACLGVDISGTYRSCLHLLARLQFEDCHVLLASSVDMGLGMLAFGTPVNATYGSDWIQQAEDVAKEALEEAACQAQKLRLETSSQVLEGAAAPALIDLADRNHADVIAVASTRKSTLGSLFLGSVSRGLTIGAHQSVLISKGQFEQSGPIRAVFATDHSLYADEALDRFLVMKPRGIQLVHVVTAINIEEQRPNGNPAPTVEKILVHEAERRNALTVHRLIEAGIAASSAVSFDSANKAIEQAMEERKADLLLIGAQGHGFMHRLFIGSTSLHQVVAEPYSVFVLRKG